MQAGDAARAARQASGGRLRRYGQGRQCDGESGLRSQKLGQCRGERAAGTRVAPGAVARTEMEAAALRRDPDFTVGKMPVDDQLAAVLALDLEDPVVQIPVEIDIRIGKRRIERCA